MREDIEKRRAEAAERKKQMEVEESAKPAFAINPKGSSKVSFGGSWTFDLLTRVFPLHTVRKRQSINTHHATGSRRPKKSRCVCF